MYNKRILELDIARTLAILCVVLCHSVELIYNMNADSWSNMSFYSKIFSKMMFTMGRFGVPLFLFISGYLLLSKNIKTDNDCIKFYKHNLLPLIIKFEVWVILYNIFISLYFKTDILISNILKNMLFLENVNIMHIWYMPTIIGLYLAIPFLSLICNKFSIKIIFIPIIIQTIIVFVFSDLNIIFNAFDLDIGISSVLDLSFLGGAYGIYLLLGYITRQKYLRNIPIYLVFLIFLIFYFFATIFQVICYNRNFTYNIWYNSFPLLISSVFLFELINRIKKCPIFIIKIVNIISKFSLAIYFLHAPILLIIIKSGMFSDLLRPISAIVLFLITIIISLIIVYIICKLPIIKNIIK